jgi:hypothetical protein
MRTAIEALLLITVLTAISMAISALHDLLTGPLSWRRKVAWSLLVVGVPLVGPVLYYQRGPDGARKRERQTRTIHKRTNGGEDEAG